MPDAAIVNIHNASDSPFSADYNGSRYTIAPNQTLTLSYDAMCLWLGHPEANDFDPRNRVRVQEYARLRVRYGVEARALELSQQGHPTDTEALFRDMRPMLECTDMEGNRILTVADDPNGDYLRPDADGQTDTQQLLLHRLEALERENRAIQAQLDQQTRTNRALDDALPVPTDESPTPPIRSSIIGSIVTEEDPLKPKSDEKHAPRSEPRTEVGQDTPTRVRVSG